MNTLKVALFCLTLNIFGAINSFAKSECHLTINTDEWVKISHQNNIAQKQYLSSLKSCVSQNQENQSLVNSVATKIIFKIENIIEEEQQENLVKFVYEILLINANTGYAPSQYTYASVHNQPANSLIAQYIKQDYSVFMEWLKKAAAQKEPQAMFNLASRLIIEDSKEAGVTQKHRKAYLILKELQKEIQTHKTQLEYLDYPVSEYLRKLKHKFSAMEVSKLEMVYPWFDFATLASN